MTLARMTRGTMSATESVDTAEAAATRIAGLVGMMKDAMMTGVMMTDVTMSAAMTSGDTEVDDGVGGEDAQKFKLCLGPFGSVHNPFDRRLSPSIPFLPLSSQCVSTGRPSTTHPPSRYRY